MKVLRKEPTLTDAGHVALDALDEALDAMHEDGYAAWDTVNDIAVALGLDWVGVTRQAILDQIHAILARAEKADARTIEATAASLASAAALMVLGGLLDVDPSLPIEEYRQAIVVRVATMVAERGNEGG